MPSMVVLESTFSTSTRIRGRNQILWNAEWFSRMVCQSPINTCTITLSLALEGRWTHNLIISTTGIISPRSLLHNSPRHRLKIQQVIARRQRRHTADPLLTVQFLRILRLFFLLDRAHVDFAQVFGCMEVLVEGVWGVDGVEFLGRVFPGVFQDDFLASGVFFDIISNYMPMNTSIELLVVAHLAGIR